MFKTIAQHNIDTVDKDWNKIWKVFVPKRCKSFLWLPKYDSLLTNLSKSRKGLGSAGCNLCGNVCETTIHAIRDCHKCVSIWTSLVSSDIHGDFFKAELGDWISINLNYSGRSSLSWSSTWIITCHALWLWRNLEEHNAEYKRPLNPIVHILQRHEDYKQAMRLLRIHNKGESDNKFIGWKPPTSSMIQLNTDGACNADNFAGCGGVLRDHNDNWKGGFSKYVDNCSALMAEFWGVLEGIKLSKARFQQFGNQCSFLDSCSSY